MQFGMSIRVPDEQGERLSAFAGALGVPLGEALGILLDHGARTGLGNSLALPGIEITSRPGFVIIEINTSVLRPMSAPQAQSFADTIKSVSTGGHTLNLDTPDAIEVTRKGNGVVVCIQRDGSTIIHRTFAPGVAKAFADRLDEAAVEAIRLEQQLLSVEQLVGDPEAGSPESYA